MMPMRRFLTQHARRPFSSQVVVGRRLESAYDRLQDSDRGREAVRAYGECLDKKMDNVSEDCCKLEFEALKKVLQEILAEQKKQ